MYRSKIAKRNERSKPKIGWRLIKNFQPLCNNELLNEYAKTVKAQEASGHYCIAFGLLGKCFKYFKERCIDRLLL